MNKRYLAVVLISMALLFTSVQAFDYFEFNKQLFPKYIPNKEPVVASFSSCSVTGTMTTNCGARSVTTCETLDNCCVWEIRGAPPADCYTKSCSALSNPDVCAGCNGCSGTWTINNARGTLSWDVDVVGRCDFTNGATMSIPTGKELTCDTVRFYTTSYCRVYTGGALRST